MKIFRILLTVFCAAALIMAAVAYFPAPGPNSAQDDAINAVIGNESYISMYGTLPGPSASDEERIFTHLSYVEQKLRDTVPEGLTQEQQQRRLAFLDHLRDYRTARDYPVNDNHPDLRRPTFISKNGNICAVGYLVEQSAGRVLAEDINKTYKYSYIKDIDAPAFLKWAAASGFTIRELAMIQPSYHNVKEVRENNDRLGTSYSIASGALITANTAYWAQDLSDSHLFSNPQTTYWTGLAVGAGTMLVGTLNLDNVTRTYDTGSNGHWSWTNTHTETNHLRTGVSAGHVVVGMATFMRSAWQLITSSPPPSPGDSGLTVTNFTLPDAGGAQTVSGVGYRFTF